MKIITLGNVVYLGEMEETKTGITLKDALCLGQVAQVEKKHLAMYIKAKNVGKLEKDIAMRGNGSMISDRPLSDDLELEFKILDLKLTQATGLAVPELINKKFDELVG